HSQSVFTDDLCAFLFAWQAVTGRSFGDKDFRSGLENGILLCELLSSIKPGLVKKINRLPTPIAGLDNLTMFLRGCEELGLKGSQLFDPGDLQDTSIRANLTGSDCSRKLKNVLITIYWLGKAANSCTTYNGPTLDLKEFEGLLSMMRKECVNEDFDSPKRSIRDSGYIDSWESERSDSLSPPRHGRDDSFDSLDSFGSRSQNTPSPDTVIRCNSDDSEGDAGHRKLPDVRKDDMSARRVSYKEPRVALPFNQYLPNKTNQTNYLPAPLRKRRSDREEDRRSLSNSTSPVGGERPLRSMSLIDMRDEEDEMAYLRPHSQSRHEHLHNQYNKLREEEDQWQDDLARWKNRRRSASQDLIKKEEERKMMEKLMTADGGSGHRRKSIKTYKEIVEEKERREQELHEQYCKASTPEEKAAVLQRYALRFTISDAILEKLQLPKLPSAAPPMHTSPLHQPEKKLTCTTLVETEVPEPEQTTQTHHSVYIEQKTTQKQAQEKYQREQEKLKEEWERAQREVEEEERRHHEEERRILEETVTPLTPQAPSLTQPSAPHDTIVLSLADWERKQEMLEKQAQTNQSSRLTHRSVSGKKLCSSCAHPLGKGAAMIIESLGLYFHIQCFMCGICKGLLGDTSAGTDVRIRNGLLNCQECYIKSRGEA
uniref:LIM and calponin homology domains 1a n=1 Tax=Cyprinus carpio TaxID=7962 RepID=A0A8C2B7L2_CYPCA